MNERRAGGFPGEPRRPGRDPRLNVVIIGSGRFGATLANRLSREGHNVAIVDVLPEAFERYLDANFAGRTVLGDGIDEDVLREAGIEQADAFVAAVHGDNHNLMAAQIAKVIYGVKRVVARCNDPVRAEMYDDLGVATVCPSVLGAAALHSALMSDARHQKDLAAGIAKLIAL